MRVKTNDYESTNYVKKYIFEKVDPYNVKLPVDVYLEAYNLSVNLKKEFNI